jgi:YgiT-type zinc finger domain-containing protein
MREKKWTDCPACGAKKSMQVRRAIRERFNPAGYSPVDISGLDGQFCESCGEGFWSLKSERKIARALAKHMAKEDSTRVVAAELASVHEAAKVMRISVQGVHKMMDEGRLRYALAAGRRLPIRKDLAEKARAKHHAPPSP